MSAGDPSLGIGGVVHKAGAVEKGGGGGTVLSSVDGAGAAVGTSVCASVDGPDVFIDEAVRYGPGIGSLGPLCVGCVLRLDGEASGELEEGTDGEGVFSGVSNLIGIGG